MEHPRKKKPDEIQRDPLREIPMGTEDWEEFEHGVTLFNTCKFWHAHEAWEEVWRRRKEDERLFFQGLIQLAAAYHHLVVKRSYVGSMNNFDKAYEKLEVFQPRYLGVNVLPLLEIIDRCRKEAATVGKHSLEQFNLDLIPKVQFCKPINPDLMIEANTFMEDKNFREGVRLFNDHYFWEAHEIWEDVWREQHGEGKMFAQAFVQMASAYSFVRLSRASTAKYLFEKAIEKFQQYETLIRKARLEPLLHHMEESVKHVSNPNQTNGSVKLLSSVPRITLPEIS